jgi:hypothetical protein
MAVGGGNAPDRLGSAKHQRDVALNSNVPIGWSFGILRTDPPFFICRLQVQYAHVRCFAIFWTLDFEQTGSIGPSSYTKLHMKKTLANTNSPPHLAAD